jgi:diacylglycerol kinase family enzyme
VRRIEPDRLAPEIAALAAAGTPRILVAGGDGSLATAASVLVRTRTALAVLPGGTLNHFAKDLGVPTDLAKAADAARRGEPITVDVARVNGRLFHGTSSVGAYVLFVHWRERLERWLPYRLASVAALVRTLVSLRSYRVSLEVEGEQRVYHTPIVFVGVGQRELKLPMLGARLPGGRRGLHVLVLCAAGRWHVLSTVAVALTRGIGAAERAGRLDSFLVERCRVELPRRRGHVSVDGEMLPIPAPLDYAVEHDALLVIAPPDDLKTGKGGES